MAGRLNPMRVLIADDDPASRRVLERFLDRWGYDVVSAEDGNQALAILEDEAPPSLILLDWMMPGVGGLELCRRIRESGRPSPAYIILVTARAGREDVVAGLESGADDYVTKPFNHTELRARIQSGTRSVELQIKLKERVQELEDAMARVKRLKGLLPICSYCKKIRTDNDYWQQVDSYITEHSEARFSHGICPDCLEGFVWPELNSHKPQKDADEKA